MTTKATRDVIDLALRPVLNVDIDGGNIDGTVIGMTTRDEGYFTNLFAENLTVTGTIDFTGAVVIGNLNAYYADIAEYYESDEEYEAGTLVSIGGEHEITITTNENRHNVFGVISSDPYLVLNADQKGIKLPVALVGRIPVKIVGPIKKGDRIMPSHVFGHGKANNDRLIFSVGRSLQTVNAEIDELHVIEAVVNIVK